MAWPVISDVIGAAKAAISSSNESNAPADAAAEVSGEDVADTAPNTEESTSEPTTPAPAAPAEPAVPETPTTLAEQIKAKGARAFFEELPSEVKEEFWSESYRRLHQTLSTERRLREQEAKRNEAAIKQHIDDRVEELLTAGMSDEEKATRAEKRELDRLRAEAKKPEPEDPLQNPEVRQRINEGWAVIQEAGLPKDQNDPRVKAVWAEAWEESDRETGLAKMRTAAQKYQKPAAPEVDIEAMVAERVAKAVDERLKKAGLLKADTGKPSAIPGNAPTTWEQARRETEQALRNAR